MRWDKADIGAYYDYTGAHLTPFVNAIDLLRASALNVPNDAANCVEHIYNSIISVLNSASCLFVPMVKKGFFKF